MICPIGCCGPRPRPYIIHMRDDISVTSMRHPITISDSATFSKQGQIKIKVSIIQIMRPCHMSKPNIYKIYLHIYLD